MVCWVIIIRGHFGKVAPPKNQIRLICTSNHVTLEWGNVRDKGYSPHRSLLRKVKVIDSFLEVVLAFLVT